MQRSRPRPARGPGEEREGKRITWGTRGVSRGREGEERGRDYAGAAKMNGSHAPVDWASTSELEGIGGKKGGGKGGGERRYGKLCGSFGACAGGGRGEEASDKRETCKLSGEEQRGSDECRDELVGGRASGYTEKNDNRMQRVDACEWGFGCRRLEAGSRRGVDVQSRRAGHCEHRRDSSAPSTMAARSSNSAVVVTY